MVIDEINGDRHGDAVSDFIVEIVGNATFTPKSTEVPTFDKIIEGEIVCDHEWAETVTKKPTCTEFGMKELICDICGEITAEVIPMLEHEYEDDVCQNCGTLEFQIVTLEELAAKPELKKKPALSMEDLSSVAVNDEDLNDESFDVQGVEIGTISVDAGGKDGTEYVKFTDSGDYDIKVEIKDDGGNTIITNIYITINNYSETHVHKWVETVIKEPTCDEDGEKELWCDRCGDIRTEKIPAIGHNYSEDGTCKNCGGHEHNYTEEITKIPTCSNAGEKTFACECGDVKTEAVPATGEHNYIETVTKTPTCSEDGERILTCSGCGDTKTETIPATGNHMDGNGDCICDSCGEHAHTYVSQSIIPTVALTSQSGSASVSVSNSASSASFNFKLTGANVSGTATCTIDIPVAGNYYFKHPSPQQNTGTGSGTGSGSSYTRTLDGETGQLWNTKYLTKGLHTYTVSITHKNFNSNTYTDESWTVTSLTQANICSKCGHIEGDEETAVAAIIQNILPVSIAAEDKNDEFIDEPITPASDSDTTVKYGIGDSVPFRLTATMPESVSAYGEYRLVFHDTVSDGLTYDEDSLRVYADGIEINPADYGVLFDGKSFAVTISDAKAEPFNAAAGSEISVKYSATLNSGAVFGNLNNACLEYSNDPNGDGTGRTTSDTVTVFTFSVSFGKVDGKTGSPLDGAGFTLYKKDADGNYAVVRDEIKDTTSFEFTGLAAGDYKLVESTTPDGYNTMEDLEFSIIAESTEDADGTAHVTLLKIVRQGETLEDGNLNGWIDSSDTGILSSSIANFRGNELPSTGGIGTTVFYAVGGVIVFAACIMLVVKRKEKMV